MQLGNQQTTAVATEPTRVALPRSIVERAVTTDNDNYRNGSR